MAQRTHTWNVPRAGTATVIRASVCATMASPVTRVRYTVENVGSGNPVCRVVSYYMLGVCLRTRK